MNIELPNNFVRFAWYFLKPYKLHALIFLSLSVCMGLWELINNYLMKYMIDALASGDVDNIASIILWPAIIFVVNFELYNFCFRGTWYLNYKYEPVIRNRIISETFEYVLQASYQFFQTNLSGKISSQIYILANNIEYIFHALSKHITRGVVVLLLAFISMYNVNPAFFWVLIIWFAAFCYFSVKISKRFVDLSQSHATAEAVVSGKLVDSIMNASNIRIFDQRTYEVSSLNKNLLLTKEAFQVRELFALRMHFFQGTSISVMIGFMLYFLIQLRIAREVSVGDFALILGLSIEVVYVTWITLERIDELSKAIGMCKQSINDLFKPLEIKDKKNALNLVVDRGEIVFDKVSFHYSEAKPLFQDMSLTIKAGQKIGLVGYSGGGKSTFVNLILRLYDISDGRIMIDGQDIRDVTLNSLHNNIAMVPQDPSLFHRSIIDNIRYGRIDATDNEIIDAAKKAHAHEFITQLPHGYRSLAGERGVKLSGGQRQRVSIARALLKNARIFMLDEATSQLDPLVESEIQKDLLQFMEGKTTLVIAHRLSTLLNMDRILVFDEGKIIQDGSHEELLALHGLYRKLWDMQIGGFLPAEN